MDISRRDALRLGATGLGAAAAVTAGGRLLGGARAAALGRPSDRPAATTRTGTLQDIEHVVVIIQENRSFDHYFGMRKGVRGFGDEAVHDVAGRPLWYQTSKAHSDGYVLPFRFDSRGAQGQCSVDPGHSWGVQHAMWDQGTLDGFARVNGPMAMGYLGREDIPWYYGLADRFTVCDMWFCSALAATNPNRYYSITGTIDPNGVHGGPGYFNGGYWYTWETYPERLQKAGISWRMYHDVDDYDDNVLKYFRQYQGLPHTSELWQNAMRNRSVAEFTADVQTGELPQLSWIIAPTALSEHPSYLPISGQEYVRHHIEALAANPKVWEKTVVLWTFDENGGFFDHVPPPTPPPGTPDEYIGTTPIGLGYRVPSMVISPWSTGGKVVSDTFDHTSILRFCETRWGVEVPNLSAWRRATCGDLTTALDMTHFDPDFPVLPSTAALEATLAKGCTARPANVVPAKQSLPTVEA